MHYKRFRSVAMQPSRGCVEPYSRQLQHGAVAADAAAILAVLPGQRVVVRLAIVSLKLGKVQRKRSVVWLQQHRALVCDHPIIVLAAAAVFPPQVGRRPLPMQPAIRATSLVGGSSNAINIASARQQKETRKKRRKRRKHGALGVERFRVTGAGIRAVRFAVRSRVIRVLFPHTHCHWPCLASLLRIAASLRLSRPRCHCRQDRGLPSSSRSTRATGCSRCCGQ